VHDAPKENSTIPSILTLDLKNDEFPRIVLHLLLLEFAANKQPID
jgi:hypothetical protein